MHDTIHASAEAAVAIASMLQEYPWYHRTSTCDHHDHGVMTTWLVVWVEGDNHDEIPTQYLGFKVKVRRVMKKSDLILGSVKPDPSVGFGNKV